MELHTGMPGQLSNGWASAKRQSSDYPRQPLAELGKSRPKEESATLIWYNPWASAVNLRGPSGSVLARDGDVNRSSPPAAFALMGCEAVIVQRIVQSSFWFVS
jgi:hypothetical protein